MINEAVFWSKQIETILIITSRDASMRYGSNRNWLPTIQNHMKIFNLRRYFKKIKKDIHASMEQKAKQTARKATLHTWNVACLQNRTDGSCLPHEPGRTSQSNSRNTIIPLTCEAFRSCFKLIRMHICRYIYNIHAICCNMMLLQCLWTFKIAHSSIWLSCRCFCHFLATVFCCDKDWRLLSCLWPWSCGRNCRPCKPANSSFLARRRIPRTSCFGFFVFFVFSSLVFRHLWGRHVLQASLFLRNLGRASVGLVGDLGCAFFHLSLLLQSLLLDLLVFISFFILHFVFFSHSITFCCIFPHFLTFFLFVYFVSICFFTRSARPLRLARSLG